MTWEEYEKQYPEAVALLRWLRDPERSKQNQLELDAMPAWKKQFLSNYTLSDH